MATSPNKRFNEQTSGSAVRFKSLYVSLPSSSAKQQREMAESYDDIFAKPP